MDFTTEVYDKYRRMVYQLAWKYNKSFEDFEDLVQEGFVGLEKACNSFDESKSKFSTYAHIKIKEQINRFNNNNNLVRISRRKKPEVHYSEFIEESAEEIDLDLKIDLSDAMNALEPEYSMLITLHFFEGMNKREIAQETGMSYGVVKNRIRKALETMKEYLG